MPATVEALRTAPVEPAHRGRRVDRAPRVPVETDPWSSGAGIQDRRRRDERSRVGMACTATRSGSGATSSSVSESCPRSNCVVKLERGRTRRPDDRREVSARTRAAPARCVSKSSEVLIRRASIAGARAAKLAFPLITVPQARALLPDGAARQRGRLRVMAPEGGRCFFSGRRAARGPQEG